MTIDEIQEIYKDRFKFNLTIYDKTPTIYPVSSSQILFTLEPTVSFVDKLDGISYKVTLHHHMLLEKIIENIIIEKRDNKIESILTKKI